MNDKYPYLNSVVFDTKNNEVSTAFSSSNSMFNDQFQDADLNYFEESYSDSPSTSEIYKWEIGMDSLEMLSDTNDSATSFHSANSFNVLSPRTFFNGSSISSLSSTTSTTDLSFPHYLSTIDNFKSNQNEIGDKQTKPNILTQFSQLFLNRSRSTKSSAETPLKSTTCLILNDRPTGLPPKSTDEVRRHQNEYKQLINNIKKKERLENQAKKVRQKSKLNQEERQYQLTTVWRNFIIPKWFHQQSSQYVRHLWWEGIPTSVRDKVWIQCIPNTLKLTKAHYENFVSQMQERIERYLEPAQTKDVFQESIDMSNGDTESRPKLRVNGVGHANSTSESRSSAYDLYILETVSIHSKRSSSNSYSNTICPPHNRKPSKSSIPSSEVDIRQILLNTIKLDVSRTFPNLNLFQNGGPHHDLLYQLLGAYTCYRPDIGYVQGMSFLAAILILVMNVEDAFICFANILEMPCHHAFYALEESEFTVFLESFKLLLFTHLPQVAQHFTSHKLDVNIFLCDWLFTIYSRTLPLETALRVWDMFCRDGEAALFRAGLGILRHYEIQLLNSNFEEMAGFLTGQMPESLSASILVDEMREIKLNNSNFRATIEEARSNLNRNKINGKVEN